MLGEAEIVSVGPKSQGGQLGKVDVSLDLPVYLGESLEGICNRLEDIQLAISEAKLPEIQAPSVSVSPIFNPQINVPKLDQPQILVTVNIPKMAYLPWVFGLNLGVLCLILLKLFLA